ncbi:MAG: YrhK family protein [Elusimicrobiota bacterium]
MLLVWTSKKKERKFGYIKDHEKEKGRSENKAGIVAILKKTVIEYEWIYIVVGILGNLFFFTGSMFLLSGQATETVSTYLWIAGSFNMLLGNLGKGLVKYYRSHKL